MKKFFAVFVTVLMLVSTLCLAVNADFDFKDGKTEYEVVTADGVSFSYEGKTTATAFPRGSSKLDCLVDGDVSKNVTAHNQDGIVLVCNDHIKPQYEENVKNSVSPAMTDQAAEDIPFYSFTLEYENMVSFDAVYISLFHEINACVAVPGDNAVTVEYSKNGTDWTPVGTDGLHYYRGCDLPDYVMDATDHNCAVEERIVPLSKKVSGKFVRLTFNFMSVPEDSAWRYYSNVFEWVGFTELAVATYESGDKPTPITKEEANIADVDVAGDWIFIGEGIVKYYSFADDGANGYVYKEMLESDYEKDGINAESQAWEGGFYSVNGNKVELSVTDEDDKLIEAKEITVSLAEGKLTLDDGIESLEFEVFTNTKPETSEPDESVDESVDESTEESKAESEEESKAESVEESAEESTEDSSYAPVNGGDDDDGMSVGLIIGIAVAAVVIVAAVVVIIIKKKK